MKTNTPLTEKQILELTKKGNTNALNTLYKMKYPIIKKLILNKGGGVEDVKDIFQDSLIVFYKNVQKPDFELTSSINTYLYAIANNLWLKEVNKRTKKKEGQSEIRGFYKKKVIAFSDDIKDEVEMKYTVMEKIIAELKDPCKSLLVNFYFKKKSMEMIAAEMGYKSATAARKQKFKCMERVRKLAFLEMKKIKTETKNDSFQRQTG